MLSTVLQLVAVYGSLLPCVAPLQHTALSIFYPPRLICAFAYMFIRMNAFTYAHSHKQEACGGLIPLCCIVCCSVIQCDAVCCSVLQCVAVCCSVIQCDAVCCSVLQCVAVCCSFTTSSIFDHLTVVCVITRDSYVFTFVSSERGKHPLCCAVYCSVLQCV